MTYVINSGKIDMDRKLVKDIGDKMPKFDFNQVVTHPGGGIDPLEGVRKHLLGLGFNEVVVEPDSGLTSASRRRMWMSAMHAAAHPRFPINPTLDTQVGPVTTEGPTLVIKRPGITTKSNLQFANQIADMLTTLKKVDDHGLAE